MSQAGILNTTVIPPPPTVVETLTGNSGGPVGPTGNNINVIGSGLINIVGTPGTSTLTVSVTEQIVSAYLATAVTDTTGDGTDYHVIFDTVFYQTGAAYNTGTGIFTAPATGNYQVNVNITIDNMTLANSEILLQIVSSSQVFSFYKSPNTYVLSSVVGSAICTMTVGDSLFITMTVSNGPKTVTVDGANIGASTNTSLQIVRVS